MKGEEKKAKFLPCFASSSSPAVTCTSSVTYFTKDIRIYDHVLIGAYVPPCLTDLKFQRGGAGGGVGLSGWAEFPKRIYSMRKRQTKCVSGRLSVHSASFCFSSTKPERLGS